MEIQRSVQALKRIMRKPLTLKPILHNREVQIQVYKVFPKGLTHGFSPKMAIFPTFLFLGNIGRENVFYDILKPKKTPFQSIKTRCSKSRKIDIFPKGLTHGFDPKMGIFPTFFFSGNIGQQNVFYDILERKNAVLGYKNKKFKKSKNRQFSKRVNSWFWSKIGHSCSIFFQAIQAKKMSFTTFYNEKPPFQAIKTRSSKHFSKGVNPWF